MISIIIGSQRADSQSLKVGTYLSERLKHRNIESNVIEISDHSLPRLDNDYNPEQSNDTRKPYAEKLYSSDAIIIVSPERGGMVPAGLKNFFLWCKHGEVAHKPGLLVGVSSGTGGAYPIAELRMSSYKNTKICYIPDHLIIRHVGNVLNGSEAADEDDIRIRARIEKTLDVLLVYSKAFTTLRNENCIVVDKMPYGM